MEIKAKVVEVGPIIQVTDTFKKRELIVEYAENPQYPDFIKFEAIQDKCNLLDKCKVGDEVEVFFNLRGRKWTDKSGKDAYFNTLQVWRVNVLDANSSSAAASPELAPPIDLSADQGDDLPF